MQVSKSRLQEENKKKVVIVTTSVCRKKSGQFAYKVCRKKYVEKSLDNYVEKSLDNLDIANECSRSECRIRLYYK